MAKAPADQFYFQDWLRDMQDHPLEIQGAWMLILCTTWWTEGKATKTLEQWARILGVSMEDTDRILTYLDQKGIAEMAWNAQECASAKLAHFAPSNTEVTITSRRQARFWKSRKDTRLRVAKHRAIKASNTDVTDPSSLSSLSSLKDNAHFAFIFEERFWPIWLKKVDKQKALKAWLRLKPSAALVEIIVADVQAKFLQEGWLKEGMQFAPYPATYLNNRRWQDQQPEQEPDYSHLIKEAKACYAKTGGACAGTWAQHSKYKDRACYWCPGYADKRKDG